MDPGPFKDQSQGTGRKLASDELRAIAVAVNVEADD
jgi:hypothetical protein